MTIAQAYRKTVDLLKNEEREPEAAEILCRLTGLNKDELFLNFDVPLLNENELFDIIKRRAAGEPLAYILKKKSFYGYDFYVDERCLIPRYDSECLVEYAIEMIKKRGYKKILDLCSGSGCLGISLKKELKEVFSYNIEVSFSDISGDATAVCLKNAGELLGYEPVSYIGDLFIPGGEKFDLIICNPPYVDIEIKDGIEAQVAQYEPHIALFAEKGGLKLYPGIAEKAYASLNSGGALICEIGYDQADAVAEIFGERGFKNIERGSDLGSRIRFICGDV